MLGMRGHVGMACVDSSNLPIRGDPAVGYVVATVAIDIPDCWIAVYRKDFYRYPYSELCQED